MEALWRPDSEAASFVIPSIWVKPNQQSKFITLEYPQYDIITNYYTRDDGAFLLPLHPGAISRFSYAEREFIGNFETGPKLHVSPTASTRTVFVRNIEGQLACQPHFLKLHFPGRISRFTRGITKTSVLHQMLVSSQLHASSLPHLPDIAGGYIEIDNATSVGFILRASNIEKDAYNRKFVIPGFSLFGIDKYKPNDPILLIQLAHMARENIADFFINRIITPAVKLWLQAVRNYGIIPELHGQNFLFAFDHECNTSIVGFRDSDIYINNTNHELDLPISVKSNEPVNVSCFILNQVLSLCYDCFLIDHFLAKIANIIHSSFGIPVELMMSAAVNTFRANGGKDLCLGDSVYYFDEHLHHNEEFILVENSSLPLWR